MSDTNGIVGELQRLCRATDKVIEQLDRSVAKEWKEAINWGDLRCVNATFRINDQGRFWYAVLIEEASPDCPKLSEAIEKGLRAEGWSGIEIETAW